MTEIEMTRGTIVLLTGTILMFVCCALGLLLYAGNFVFLLILISPILGVLASYSAATDRDMASFITPPGRFGTPKYVGESCAASTFGGIAILMNSVLIVTFGLILMDGFDANMVLITLLLLSGTVLTAIGSYVAWTEWEG